MVTGKDISEQFSSDRLRRGHEIRLDSDFTANVLSGWVPIIQTINKDIRDVSHADLEGVDAVLHLAGLSNDPLGTKPKINFEINQGSVAGQIQKVGVERFIFPHLAAIMVPRVLMGK